MIALVLETTRRVVGWFLVAMVLAALGIWIFQQTRRAKQEMQRRLSISRRVV